MNRYALYDTKNSVLCRLERGLWRHIRRTSAAMKASDSARHRQEKPPVAALPNAVTLALGKNINNFRLAAEMSQEQLARDAEIERSRISKMENGHVNPSLLTLATLCHCLNISLPQLFEGITATLPPTADGGPPRRKNQARLDKPTQKVGGRTRSR